MSTDALIVNAVCELQRHGNTHAEACRLVLAWLAEHDQQVAEQIAAAIETGVDMADHAYVRTGMRSAVKIAREAVR